MEGFIEVIVVKVGFELGGNGTFEYFGEKWEIGDGTVVVGGVGVETRFLEDGGDGSQFEGRRDRTRGQRGVDYVGDEWCESWEAGCDQGGWNWVKDAMDFLRFLLVIVHCLG